jgi:polyisoprenoid-binding protein YceI
VSDSPVVAAREHEGTVIPAVGEYHVDPAHSRVSFVVRHLMVSKVRGEFGEAHTTITVAEDPFQSSVTSVIQVASVHTNQPQRDGHLRSGDFFLAETYPTMTYRSTGIKSFKEGTFVVEGELTIKDVTKPVELKVELEGVTRSPQGKNVFGFSATTEINRDDFGLSYNAALETGGVMIGQNIKIEIEGEAVRQEPDA